MSTTRTITIREVEARTTSEGAKRTGECGPTSGSRSSHGRRALAEQLDRGSTAVVTTNGSAEYPKIVDVHARDAATPDPAVDPAPAEPPSAVSERERRMLRMSALRAAADVLHGSHVPAGEVIEYAEQLLMWLEG
jgi:hypothetical protein